MSQIENNNMESFEVYFDHQINVDDFVGMDDREAFLTQLIQDNSLSDDEVAKFEEDFEAEVKALYEEAFVARAELGAMLKSGNLTVAEAASVELAMADLDVLIDTLGDDDELLDEWGDALESYADQNVELKNGESHTIDLSDAKAGQTYAVAVVESEEKLGAFDEGASSKGWWDTDSDGYTDTFWDRNRDGVADQDFNKDGVIDEFDNAAYVSPEAQPSVVIALQEGDTLDFSSFEKGPPSVSTFKVTKENGDEVFIQVTGEAKIISETVPNNLDSMPSDVTSRMYEGADKKFPCSYYIDGTLPRHMQDVEYKTILNMADQDYEYDINPSSLDYTMGREYTVNFTDGESDSLSLNLSDDAVVSFSQDDPESLLITMTITTDEGEVTIHLVGFQADTSGENLVTDSIDISGGSIELGNIGEIGVDYHRLDSFYYLGGVVSDGDS